jgi:hypothetical protein
MKICKYLILIKKYYLYYINNIMGGGHSSVCSSMDKPNTDNICNDALGGIGKPWSNYCTSDTGTGTSKARAFCNSIGNNGEWGYDSRAGSCNYNDCDGKTQMSSGCCNGCCGVSGKGVNCKRNAFKADPLTCCLNDMSCNPSPQNCFENSNSGLTCDPVNRNQTSTSCQTNMLAYCTGADVPQGTSEIWMNRWLNKVTYNGVEYDKPCLNTIYRNLYNGQPSIECLGNPITSQIVSPTINTEGYVFGQNLMTQMIARLIQDGGDLVATESTESNNLMSSTIFEICNLNPGLCQNALYSYCANVTTDDLIRNPSLLTYCGCYMPPEQYSKYTDLYHVDKQCAPTCNMSGVIPLADASGTSTLTCNQTTCIIDDVSINIASSIVGGTGTGISFNQICNSCSIGGGTCSCLVTGSTINIIDSTVGSLNLSQQCTGSNACYSEVTQPDGTIVNQQVSCSSDSLTIDSYQKIQNQNEQNQKNAIWNRNMKILIVFGVLIIIIIVIYLLFHPNTAPRTNKTIVKHPPKKIGGSTDIGTNKKIGGSTDIGTKNIENTLERSNKPILNSINFEKELIGNKSYIDNGKNKSNEIGSIKL